MGHFALSMLILVAATALAWRARYEPGERPRSLDRVGVWSVRMLLPLGAVTIFAGTVATAAGPHAGAAGTGETIDRLGWKGLSTLDWAIHQHGRIATVLGIAVVAVYVLLRRRGAPDDVLRPVAFTAILLAVQGAVGGIQYALEAPAEIVWVHVSLAALTWIALLWSTAAAGSPAPASVPLPATPEEAAETPSAHIGAVLGGSGRVAR
jgi:cytochrome c oxidase assembly protein subunit 15